MTTDDLYAEIAHEHDFGADPVYAPVELPEPPATPKTVLTAAERDELDAWLDMVAAMLVELAVAA